MSRCHSVDNKWTNNSGALHPIVLKFFFASIWAKKLCLKNVYFSWARIGSAGGLKTLICQDIQPFNKVLV